MRLQKADICMNSKSEFRQPGIVRVMAVKENLNEEQAAIFPLDGRRGGPRGARGRGSMRVGRGNTRGKGARPRGQ